MRQMWQVWEGAIPSQEIDWINKTCLRYRPEDGRLSDSNGQYSGRSSTIRWVDKYSHENQHIINTINMYGMEANRALWGFDLSGIGSVQHTEYRDDQQGEYNWHYDTGWGNPQGFDRKLSMVIQLSDSNDYEGGDFEIERAYGNIPRTARKKGSVIVFPSYLYHRVTPVTRGIRHSLVAWIEGPKFR
jgi:PKHD-type hydroxylase